MKMRDRKNVTNIVVFYGSWTQGSTYNVLLEYANSGNLEDFWKNTNQPTKEEDITLFWSRFLDVAQILPRIHEFEELGEGSTTLQGYEYPLRSVTMANKLLGSTRTSSLRTSWFSLIAKMILTSHSNLQTSD
jgi:hypothetical protein